MANILVSITETSPKVERLPFITTLFNTVLPITDKFLFNKKFSEALKSNPTLIDVLDISKQLFLVSEEKLAIILLLLEFCFIENAGLFEEEGLSTSK